MKILEFGRKYLFRTHILLMFLLLGIFLGFFLITKYISYSRGQTTYTDLSLDTLPDTEIYEPEIVYSVLDTGKIEIAKDILRNCWTLPRYETVCFDDLPKWNENPYDEKYWRFDFYSLRPLRHLLWAYRNTDDLQYANKLIEILRSYVNTNTDTEYFNDKHATSFRVMMQVNMYFKLKNDGILPADLDEKLIAKITQDSEFLFKEENFERDQNHGYTEAAALLLAGSNFKSIPRSKDWVDLAVSRLDLLMKEVVDEDGIQVEQSPYYHFYTLDFAFQIYAWASKNNVRLSASYSTKLKEMLDYATYVVLPDGQVPMIGSSLEKNIYNTQDSVLRLLAELNDNFNYVLSKGAGGVKPDNNYVLFPTGGQFIYKSDFGNFENYSEQTQLIFDVGPFRTSHSHLDALSVMLYSNEMITLSDSGLYTYEMNENHNYFFGTYSHNTVVVDDKDQAIGTAHPGRTIESEGVIYQSGWHNLYSGVNHKRAVMILDENAFIVLDELSSDSNHSYKQNWHLFPEAETATVGGVTRVRKGDSTIMQITQANSDTLTLSNFKGEENPMRGWISSEYEKKEPLPMLEYKADGNNKTFATLFTMDESADEVTSIDFVQNGSSYVINVTVGERNYVINVANFAMDGENMTVTTPN